MFELNQLIDEYVEASVAAQKIEDANSPEHKEAKDEVLNRAVRIFYALRKKTVKDHDITRGRSFKEQIEAVFTEAQKRIGELKSDQPENEKAIEEKITKDRLSQFENGTDSYHRYPNGLICTDGVHYLGQNGAYWLVNMIASYQGEPVLSGSLKHYQYWKLTVADNRGTLTCCADSDIPPVITREIGYTDFPLDEVNIWVQSGSLDGVTPMMIAMLPSEH